VASSDLKYTPRNDLLFDWEIARIGFPSDVVTPIVNFGSDADQFGALAELRRGESRQNARQLLARHLFYLLALTQEKHTVLERLNDGEIQEIITAARNDDIGLDCVYELGTVLGEGDEAVEIFDLLSNIKEINRGVRDRTAEAGEFLEQTAIASPHRGGVLRLLAKACTDGYTPEDPRLVPNPARFDDTRMRVAAWLVILAQGRLPPERADTLVKALIDGLAEEPTALDDALGIISNNDLPDASAEAVLLALMETLPPERWQTRGTVIAAMQEHQRRYPSADPDLA